MPPIARKLIPAAVVLVLALYPDSMVSFFSGMILTAAALFFIPWAIYSLVRMAIRPAERRHRATLIAIWIPVFVIALTVRANWDTDAREEVNKIASAVKAHKGRTGAYPSSLNDVGFDLAALKQKFSLSYRVNDGKAFLFYSQPSMPMVAHHYNFETNSWGEQH